VRLRARHDLAEAHLRALDWLRRSGADNCHEAFNLAPTGLKYRSDAGRWPPMSRRSSGPHWTAHAWPLASVSEQPGM
jgi:hypothetical protein